MPAYGRYAARAAGTDDEDLRMKYFIITVDTEGDDLWSYRDGSPITTENSRYIPRFQDLCEKYGFIPTYLTNYEMATDDRWRSYAKQKAKEQKCEIGMHLHAWNSPPAYELENKFGGNSYITEYPADVMREKIDRMKRLLEERFEISVTSNRSGRWATNDAYFQALANSGVTVDCSVTPQLDFSYVAGRSVEKGSDYRRCSVRPYRLCGELIEVPMTTRRIRHASQGSVKHRIKTLLLGDDCWLRPLHGSCKALIDLTGHVEKEPCEYLEFMLHSSELMPGGSPYFKDDTAVEQLYTVLDAYFEYLTEKGYRGIALTEYADLIRDTLI